MIYNIKNDKEITIMIIIVFMFGIMIGAFLMAKLTNIKMTEDYCKNLETIKNI